MLTDASALTALVSGLTNTIRPAPAINHPTRHTISLPETIKQPAIDKPKPVP